MAANDTLYGGTGADTMSGDADGQHPGHYYEPGLVQGGNDLLDGGDGADVLAGDVRHAVFGQQHDYVIGGNDTLYGGADDDFLYGDVATTELNFSGAVDVRGGDDWLDGGSGRDKMYGGGGNDGYVVDNVGDLIDESGASGIDTVFSGISFDFTAGAIVGAVENLTLIGTGAIDGIGNSLANVMVGNAAANRLGGNDGDDTLRGGAGKDSLDGGAGRDTVDYSDQSKAVQLTLKTSHTVTVKIAGKSDDKIKNFENATGGTGRDKLSGDSKANGLDGGTGNDSLKGSGGTDTLDGGLGKDQLSGGSGKDKFVFSTALSNKNVDTVSDFKHSQDKIGLDDAVFAAIGIKLDKAEFYAKGGAKAAHDADDHIIYNKSNGKLYYDHDGVGGLGAVQFAVLSGHPSLSAGDFAIV